MVSNAILLLVAALLSVAVKYGLPWLNVQPTPILVGFLVAGPAVGMALWLLVSAAVPPKNS